MSLISYPFVEENVKLWTTNAVSFMDTPFLWLKQGQFWMIEEVPGWNKVLGGYSGQGCEDF